MLLIRRSYIARSAAVGDEIRCRCRCAAPSQAIDADEWFPLIDIRADASKSFEGLIVGITQVMVYSYIDLLYSICRVLYRNRWKLVKR